MLAYVRMRPSCVFWGYVPLARSCEYALNLRVPLTERKMIYLVLQTNVMSKLAQTYDQEVPASNPAVASAFQNDVGPGFKLLPDKSRGSIWNWVTVTSFHLHAYLFFINHATVWRNVSCAALMPPFDATYPVPLSCDHLTQHILCRSHATVWRNISCAALMRPFDATYPVPLAALIHETIN